MLLVGSGLIAASAYAAWAATDAGTFRIGLGQIDHIDPALADGGPSWSLAYATGALLLNYPDTPARRAPGSPQRWRADFRGFRATARRSCFG
jgi:hypothetical protein